MVVRTQRVSIGIFEFAELSHERDIEQLLLGEEQRLSKAMKGQLQTSYCAD